MESEVSDLIACPKCGKETNKFSPVCEYCFAPLPKETPKPTGAPGPDAVVIPKTPPSPAPKTVKKAWKGKLAYFALFVFAVIAISALSTMTLIYFGTFGSKLSAGSPPRHFSRLSDLSDELKRDAAKADYVKNYISLTGVGTLDESESGSTTSKKYFYGTVRNSGAKLVIKLTATVYYYDKKERCIAEGSVPIVLGTKSKPDSLKPNSSKEFQKPITNINPEWSGRIRAKISDIEFAD